ncbi:MAG: ABC transporter substrate-binding protein [Thermodesulfobacteriota bacterium]|nr:ABC transporter substrate-binding protein [Thermodesulfobacteriota bacterium]
MAEQMAVIEKIGAAVHRLKTAKAYTAYYTAIIKRVRSVTQTIPVEKRVRLYHTVNEPLRTDGPGTPEADWTAACGVINVSVEKTLSKRKNKHFASMEQILIWNPEVIIVNEQGVDRKILNNRRRSAIQAVKDNKVYAIPVGISRWGHPGGLETPLAILWTAETVYPHRFKDLDLVSEIKGFYNTFFNLDPGLGMPERILTNQGMRNSCK